MVQIFVIEYYVIFREIAVLFVIVVVSFSRTL